MKKVLLLFLFSIFLVSTINLIDAGVYSSCEIYGNCKTNPSTVPSSVNYSVINTNNSQYLQGYTPATLYTYFESLFDNIYCKLTGCTMNSSNSGINQVNHIQFNITPSAITNAEGLLKWNPTDGTLDLGMQGGTITQQIGQEMFTKVRNEAGYETISNGQVVYIYGRTGVYPDVKKARSDNESTSMVIGVATEDLLSPSFGYITTMGYVRGIKTDYSGDGIWGTTWAEGDLLYVSKTDAGVLTNVEPSVPHHSDIIGTVGVISSNQGSILVNINTHKTFEELTDVDGTPLNTTGQIAVWNETAGYFDFNYNINNLSSIYVPYTGANQNVDLGNNNFQVDTKTLFVNASSHKVGIGVTNPVDLLSILSEDGNADMSIQVNNNSIAPRPSFRFWRRGQGGTNMTPANARMGLISFNGIGTDNATQFTSAYIDSFISGEPTATNKAKGDLRFYVHDGTSAGQTEAMRINSSGNIGIGTSTADEKLEVNGNIMVNDNQYMIFGTGKDSSIYYNSTDMIFNSRDVGTGDYWFTGGNITVSKSIIVTDKIKLLGGASGFTTIWNNGGNLEMSSEANRGIRILPNANGGNTIVKQSARNPAGGIGFGIYSSTTAPLVPLYSLDISHTNVNSTLDYFMRLRDGVVDSFGSPAGGNEIANIMYDGTFYTRGNIGIKVVNATQALQVLGNTTLNGTLLVGSRTLTVNSAEQVLLGTTTPVSGVSLFITKDGTTSTNNTVIRLGQYSDTSARRNAFVFYRSGGTEAVPTITPNDAQIFGLIGNTNNGTTNQDVISIEGYLRNNSGYQEGELRFITKNLSDTTTKTRLTIEPDGDLSVAKDILPVTNTISSLGSTALRWLKGWFTSIDVGNSSANVTLDTDGIYLRGDATQWDDVSVPVSGLQRGVKTPVFDENTKAWYFEDQAIVGNEQYVFGQFEMPHGWELGTNLHCHIHTHPSSTNVGNATFELNYTWTNIGAVEGTTTSIYLNVSYNGTVGLVQIPEWADINGTGKTLSSTIEYKLTRKSSLASDTFTGNAYVDNFGCHYIINSLGSKQELVK